MPTLNINIPDADETTKGIAEVATQAEVNTGTDDERIITPAKLAGSDLASNVATNNAKLSNVSTDLSEGTTTTTTVEVNSSDGTNATLQPASTLRAGVMSKAKFDEVEANNAKVSNATHTGQVTGDGALTVQPQAITDQTAGTVASGDLVLIADVDDSNNLKKVTAQSIADLGGGGSTATYVFQYEGFSFAPADSTTYYFAAGYDGTPPSTATNGNRRHKMPVNASNFRMSLGLSCSFCTNETSTFTLRNHTKGTQANFTTSHVMRSGGQADAAYYTVSLDCDQNDYVEFLWTTPAWATNPSNVRINVMVTFEAD